MKSLLAWFDIHLFVYFCANNCGTPLYFWHWRGLLILSTVILLHRKVDIFLIFRTVSRFYTHTFISCCVSCVSSTHIGHTFSAGTQLFLIQTFHICIYVGVYFSSHLAMLPKFQSDTVVSRPMGSAQCDNYLYKEK